MNIFFAFFVLDDTEAVLQHNIPPSAGNNMRRGLLYGFLQGSELLQHDEGVFHIRNGRIDNFCPIGQAADTAMHTAQADAAVIGAGAQPFRELTAEPIKQRRVFLQQLIGIGGNELMIVEIEAKEKLLIIGIKAEDIFALERVFHFPLKIGHNASQRFHLGLEVEAGKGVFHLMNDSSSIFRQGAADIRNRGRTACIFEIQPQVIREGIFAILVCAQV